MSCLLIWTLRRVRLSWLFLLSLCLAPTLLAQQEAAALKEIKNFYRVSDSIGSAGQPTPEQFKAIKEAGYDVVVNLAPSDVPNALKNEGEVVEGLGLKYVHIPVVFSAPKPDEAERFFAAMEAAKGKKVFVHCIANYRAASFIYLYRVTKQGVPEADAARDLHSLWTPNEKWQKFIDEVKAQAR